MNKKKVKKQKNILRKLKKTKGQSLPVILVLASLLGILATALLNLLVYESKFMVKSSCITQKQELATLALEHVMYKLQQEDLWTNPPATFYGYTHEFTSDLGNYAVHVTPGNLFFTTLTDPSTRQAKTEFKTIGIKVKTSTLNCTGAYYAVIQRMSFGGPLVSKGKIALPCTTAKADDPNFYWGDIFSANTNTGYCRIPLVNVTKQVAGYRAQWLPKVYSNNDIFTTVGYGTGRTGTYIFATTYDDMSPTAHCHPYSEFAQAPEVDYDSYRMQAKLQGSYYGPPTIPGIGANPYYINDGLHDVVTAGTMTNDVTQANVVNIMGKLRNIASVLFIDTTDGLPVRTTPCNTYAGSVNITANYATDKALRFYVSDTNQYMTAGTLVVQGPLMLIGDRPDKIAAPGGFIWGYGFGSGTTADDIWNVKHPDNNYYPQNNDGAHYVRNFADDSLSRLENVKHYGTIYMGGELRIGGPRTAGAPVSNVCIYGAIYLDPLGKLSMEGETATTYDNSLLYVYYNRDFNSFGMQGGSVEVVSFSEFTFLIPTPNPVYPASF